MSDLMHFKNKKTHLIFLQVIFKHIYIPFGLKNALLKSYVILQEINLDEILEELERPIDEDLSDCDEESEQEVRVYIIPPNEDSGNEETVEIFNLHSKQLKTNGSYEVGSTNDEINVPSKAKNLLKMTKSLTVAGS